VLLNAILVKTALNDLRKTLPAAFKSISIATINHYYHLCCSITDAYIDGHKYGTKAFAERRDGSGADRFWWTGLTGSSGPYCRTG
jgi:hypothetical protein